MTSPAGPATVSTLKEAAHFTAAGVRDMIYAVGITAAKLPQVLELRALAVRPGSRSCAARSGRTGTTAGWSSARAPACTSGASSVAWRKRRPGAAWRCTSTRR